METKCFSGLSMNGWWKKHKFYCWFVKCKATLKRDGLFLYKRQPLKILVFITLEVAFVFVVVLQNLKIIAKDSYDQKKRTLVSLPHMPLWHRCINSQPPGPHVLLKECVCPPSCPHCECMQGWKCIICCRVQLLSCCLWVPAAQHGMGKYELFLHLYCPALWAIQFS